MEDKNGVLWFGTRDELYTFQNEKFSIFKASNGNSLFNVRTIIKDQQDRMWYGGNNGLWMFDDGEEEQIMTAFTGYIYESPSGIVYAGIANGSGRNWTLNRFETVSAPLNEMNHKEIREQEGQIFGIMEDKDGVLWYGTERGVVQVME